MLPIYEHLYQSYDILNFVPHSEKKQKNPRHPSRADDDGVNRNSDKGVLVVSFTSMMIAFGNV